MMTFRIHLKIPKKNKFVRNKFKNEKLFKQKIDEKLSEQNVINIQDTKEVIQKLNVTMIDTETEILGKYREKKKNWITNELMDMCDLRRTLKQTKFEPRNKYK